MKRRWRWRPSTSRAALLLATAWAAPAGADTCADCHEEAPIEASVHVDLACTDCHYDLADPDLEPYPHPEDMVRGDNTCAACHDALAASVHAGLTSCADCHGEAHAVLAVNELDSPASPARQPASCGECHGEPAVLRGFLESVHGHALLRSGLVGTAPSCASCHGAHDIKAPSDPQAATSRARSPQLCGDCHRLVLDTWLEHGSHGRAWAELDPEARTIDDSVPTCEDCHASHAVARASEDAERLASAEHCNSCHGGRFATYRDSFHGKVTSLGFELAAVCTDCHTPHGNLPAGDLASSVHAENLAATCGTCHPGTNAGFLTFDPHADPSDPERNRWVHVTWLFMTGLLLSVFGFFAVHDSLWLQRSAVAWRRGELEHVRGHDGPWIRRFRPVHVWTHVVIVVTFLVLAATGLPIKFYATDWAQALARVPGGVETARFAHRVAAVITFGYAFFHVGWLIRRKLAGAKGYFFGWRSMVPWPRDFVDLWHHVRYFLYLGPRPSFDRYAYWEKFDYFAVFWGVPIIGVSGLMLWWPNFFTSFLPGWTLNAAFVVHSDEALLATGFIFIFHFFHTHVRPESFPMDPVIFLGCMPLERFKHERPDEYRRLAEDGLLDAMMVEAPSKQAQLRAHVFGFASVGVGVLLAVAIFVSLLAGYH